MGENHYRYGFNGKENTESDHSPWVGFEFRQYESRLGRFISCDPLTKMYCSSSPYSFALNSPIKMADILGAGPGDKTKATTIVSGQDAEGATYMQQTSTFSTEGKNSDGEAVVYIYIEKVTNKIRNNGMVEKGVVVTTSFTSTTKKDGSVEISEVSVTERNQLNGEFGLLESWTNSVVDFIQDRTDNFKGYNEHFYTETTEKLLFAGLAALTPFITTGLLRSPKINPAISLAADYLLSELVDPSTIMFKVTGSPSGAPVANVPVSFLRLTDSYKVMRSSGSATPSVLKYPKTGKPYVTDTWLGIEFTMGAKGPLNIEQELGWDIRKGMQ